MLGANELKHTFQNSPQQIGDLLDKFFVKVILNRKSQFKDKCPQVLIVSLPIINEKPKYASERYINGTEKSKKLDKVYSEVAKRNSCYFVDASNMEVGSDGVHLTGESHIKLAQILCKEIKSIKL